MPYADRKLSTGGTIAEGGVAGFADAASEIKSLLSDLAGEIDDTRRRQSHALLQIERKLFSMQSANGGTRHAARGDSALDPWDHDSAEELARLYEGEAGNALGYDHAYSEENANADVAGRPRTAAEARDWLQSRFTDISQHIARSLSELRPQGAVHALGERLERFHNHVDTALYDVARRSDLGGLKMIETHVAELGAKLADVQSHLQRLDGIEAKLSAMMDQIASGQLIKMSEHENILADVIDQTAARTAEALHGRLAEANAISAVDAGRFDELRSLIESSIVEYRHAQANTTAAIAGLTLPAGEPRDQGGRLDNLAAFIEASMGERRKGEQDTLSMLDTVQHALVQVLDRMDAIELPQPASLSPQGAARVAIDDTGPLVAALSAEAALAAEALAAEALAAEAAQPAEQMRAVKDIPVDALAPYFDVTPSNRWLQESQGEPANSLAPSSAIVRGASLTIDANQPSATPDADLSPVERMRRDFIADAQRAKLKAASSRSPNVGEMPKAAKASPTLPGRILGMSPKLLAGVLGLVVAINGGLLMLSHQTPTQPRVVDTSSNPAAAESKSAPAADSTGRAPDASGTPGKSSELGAAHGHGDERTTEAAEALAAAVSGFMYDDETGHASAPKAEGGAPAAFAPRGTTVEKSESPMAKETLAAVYEQKVLAGRSRDLGVVAAKSTQDVLQPERAGVVVTSFTPPDDAAAETTPADSSAAARPNALDLPPPTVGPLSLRLAAANGDASAEFEVAARLAEGKGTDQNFKEAIRWYQRSAARGFAQAQYRLGTLYERGLGVSKDVARARVWYLRAAEQGNVKAMHNFAVLCAGGDGGKADYATALSWFVKAADHGLADSQYNLAVLYENALGVAQDRVLAFKWYSLAARGGDKDAAERRDALKGSLDAHDLKTADEMVKGFVAQMSDPLANDARAAGEDWKKRAENGNNN